MTRLPKDDWLLLETDDGVRVSLSSFAGGNHKDGMWGSLTLMREHAGGEVEVREFKAVSDWQAPELRTRRHDRRE